MQFIYAKDAGKSRLILSTVEFAHIFKVRRVRNGAILNFRNFGDDLLYRYKLMDIDKKNAVLELVDSKISKIESENYLHVGWCVIDPKIVEKTLPFLNELGVSKISFVYCELSQRNFKIDLKRVERILINSSQQCGRSSIIEIEILNSLEDFILRYPDSKILDFSENVIEKKETINSFLVGCEGGFTRNERKIFDRKNIIGLKNPMILRSETAVLTLSALNS